MGRQQVEVVRRMCVAFARGDWASGAEPGRGKGSGVEVERRFAQLWTVRDGKVVRFRAYADRDEALRAASEDS